MEFKKSGENSSDSAFNDFLNEDRLRARLKVGRIEPFVEIEPDLPTLKAAGIRVLEGNHVQIFTDLPPSPEIDELPQVFDAAFAPWCEYFRVDPQQNSDWKIKAVLMSERSKFIPLGLYPSDLPPFLHGYARGDSVWLLDQPSDYYRRHLLLHEGTHAFMNILLGGAGPPWYMEGMAEYFATHRWANGQLTTRTMPESAAEVPLWGRIKIIQDQIEARNLFSLQRVMSHPSEAFLKNEPYAWCWAICAFLDNHSLSQQRFRDMVTKVRLTGGFSEQLFSELGADWPPLEENWEVFVINIDHGYDWQANEIVYRPEIPFSGEVMTAQIDAGKGWQSTGIQLSPNVNYQITASGRYRVKAGDPAWESEPNGITIQYHNGMPLGGLQGAIRDSNWQGKTISGLANPSHVGLSNTVKSDKPVALFLKINESPAELSDNQGTILVEVREAPKEVPTNDQ